MGKVKICLKKLAIGALIIWTFALQFSASPQQKVPEVPYVPTPENVIEEMLGLAEIVKDDVLYDLGCGDGRIVITAAKEFGCRGIGIDINPVRIKESRENAAKAGVLDKVEFHEQDLFETDFSDATVMTLYLLSTVNLRLRPILLRELKPGTRLVSHDFYMGNWDPDKSKTINNGMHMHKVYFWVIPANISGVWKWNPPGQDNNVEYMVRFDQSFQELIGVDMLENTSVKSVIIAENIIGTHVKFSMERQTEGNIERIEYEGEIEGNIIAGTARIQGSQAAAKWRAERDPSTVRDIDENH